MVSSNNIVIIMTDYEMTDMTGRASRYTRFITMIFMNFYVPPGILKFRVYALSGIYIFGYVNFGSTHTFGYMHFRFDAIVPISSYTYLIRLSKVREICDREKQRKKKKKKKKNNNPQGMRLSGVCRGFLKINMQ